MSNMAWMSPAPNDPVAWKTSDANGCYRVAQSCTGVAGWGRVLTYVLATVAHRPVAAGGFVISSGRFFAQRPKSATPTRVAGERPVD